MKDTVEYKDNSGETLFITTVGDDLHIIIGKHGNKVQIPEKLLMEMISSLRPFNAKHARNSTPCN